MFGLNSGTIRLFRVRGIDVFLHWSWFLVAYYDLSIRGNAYHSQVWNVAEYLSLFGIVLLHEFGHALACRSVGGAANRIVLWPLGGVAFVAPPPRPGAVLWSIAAGPLVNVAIAAVTTPLMIATNGFAGLAHDPKLFLGMFWQINLVLLVFNLFPVYPLDGGQILQSLLWFVIGRARSLMVASAIGLAVAVGVAGLALYFGNYWLVIMAAFIGWRAWAGFQQARVLALAMKIPRRSGLACPSCKAAPPMADVWTCGHCRAQFDMFGRAATCPGCRRQFEQAPCPDCGRVHPIEAWLPPTPKPIKDHLAPIDEF